MSHFIKSITHVVGSSQVVGLPVEVKCNAYNKMNIVRTDTSGMEHHGQGEGGKLSGLFPFKDARYGGWIFQAGLSLDQLCDF